MPVAASLRAAGNTHPGLLRDSNEDRFHYDVARGIFIVIDGVGGQAAGEKAADIALTRIRERLETGSEPADARIRQAIASANTEILRVAALRPEWKGMACVLTVAVVENGSAVIGHVGDTRAYKLRSGRIEKLTRDHSPVGEREDAGELSEEDAMRHPRRNEVYRDVGSEPHAAADPEFIDVFHVPFESDAALLLCSDGLTDGVPSATIRAIVDESAGHPYEVVRGLIDAANDAGGKDNVTVVYAEGARFVEGEDTRDLRRRHRTAARPHPQRAVAEPVPASRAPWRLLALLVALFATIALAGYAMRDRWLPLVRTAAIAPAATRLTVNAGESIAAAMASAAPGAEIVVEPGEYRERIVLRDGVRLRSRVGRAASIRLPSGASESDAAVVASDLSDGEFSGFRIVGDAATPLGTGILLRNAQVRIVDVEISGARNAAIEFASGAGGEVLASDLHDNAGLAVLVRAGTSPRIAHSVFARNATSAAAAGPLVVEAGGKVDLRRNVFVGTSAEGLVLPGGAGVSLADNWFVAASDRQAPAAPQRGGSRGRGRR
jgi:serine/threonine protein phosphatase PrpC